MRIIFMGTPEFAVPGLVKLIEAKKNVVGVITAPDKPAGRGLKAQYSAVKTAALEYNLPILQPANLKSEDFLNQLKDLQPDLQIVIAFRMLPEVVWNFPPKGTFNLHASLLPQYRGAAPINWAIINGENETGVSTFFLQHQIDTGNIIFQEKIPIGQTQTFGDLYESLKILGADLVLKTVQAIEQNNCPSIPQQVVQELKAAPKLSKETIKIDWNNSAEYLVNFVRGLNPIPTAWTILNDKIYKVYQAEVSNNFSPIPGTLDTDTKSYIRVQTNEGSLKLLEIQLEGKKRMKVVDFLRGNKL